MIKVLEKAIEKVRKLPEDRQAYAAEVLEQIAAQHHGVFQIPDDHIAAVMEGLEQAERGEFATDEEVKAFFARHGKPGA